MKETCNTLHKSLPARPPVSKVSNETVENIRKCFVKNPKKSVREIGVPKTAVQKVFKKWFRLIRYKLQLLYVWGQEITLKDLAFDVDIDEVEADDNFLNRVV